MGQSQDLDPLDKLCQEIKRTVHKRMPANFNDLKQHCKERELFISSFYSEPWSRSFQLPAELAQLTLLTLWRL